MDIADAIMSQLFEKVSVIPYAIRQFCKMLYQKTLDKFGSKVDYERATQLVNSYLLNKWLLKACFKDLHLEGLTKEFYLGAYCKKNLHLVSLIVERMMNSQEWEVPTPVSEQLPDHIAERDDLFRMSKLKKEQKKELVNIFYKELLQLGKKG